MGGAVSAGENNDELIDNLKDADYIISDEIEEIFRAVDRGAFFLKEHRESAYHDMAWKHEHLHISAPCIYSKVMSSLDLKPGLSFLNIGSGTGYLSTMVGLTLGINGINHGIELHEDVVEYARAKVKEFMIKSHAFDKYTFCMPEFVVGNCLHLSPDIPGYDRIYCGAACPAEYESFMKNLLNINGLLVMPFNDQLQVIKRCSQTKWESRNILVVNFASLAVPSEEDRSVAILPQRDPQSLRSMCRACIRKVLSKNFHTGSNRRYNKKLRTDSTAGGREARIRSRRLPEPVSSNSDSDIDMSVDHADNTTDRTKGTDQEDSDREKKKYPEKKRSSILNVATNTLETIGDDQDRRSSLTPSSSNRTSSSQSSRHSARGDDSSSSSSSLRKSKGSRETRPSRNDRDDADDSSSAKLKRARRGWAYIRHRFKNRKTEKSVFSSKQSNSKNISKKNEQSTSAAQQSDSDVPHHSDSDDPDPPVHQVSIHVRSDATSLRSFLVGMSTRMNSSLTSPLSRERVRDILLGPQRQEEEMQRLPYRVDDDDDVYSARDDDPLPDRFRIAVFKLPIPEMIKQYLLFYRVPN
ncbi:uncharacterized protein LOC143448280 isoform X2 [Clavelina lepadiformis]|uniref:uncharacterized protein LOC143448280 isoform X2 n=1 Tax=Clavelina lepadiformis TaxID=159417 RepID=UPI004042E4D1